MTKNTLKFEYNPKLQASGLWFRGVFVYARLQFKRTIILLDRSLAFTRRLVDLLIFLIAALGWIALAWYIWGNFSFILQDPLLLVADQHILLLAFYLSLGADLFLYYRSRLRARDLFKIDYRHFRLDPAKDVFKREDPWAVETALSNEARLLLEDAYLATFKLKHSELGVLILFRTLLKNKTVQSLFIRLNVDGARLITFLDKRLALGEASGQPKVADKINEILVLAAISALERKQLAVEVLDLVAPCYARDPILAEILFDLGIEEDKLYNGIEWFKINERFSADYEKYHEAAYLKPATAMNRAYTAIATPTLDHFSRDLTLAARSGRLELCLGRQKEFITLFDAWASGQAGILVTGPNGVGKRTFVEGLAQMMVEESVPEFLQDKRLVELNLAPLISGASPAEAQRRLLVSLSEANRSGNVILYVPNVERLLGISAGEEESFELAEVLVEVIEKQALYCILTATTENYSKYLEKSSLGSVVTMIGLEEPTVNQAIQILQSKASALEKQYGVFLTYGALAKAVDLSSKFLSTSASPLRDINLLQKAVIITSKAGAHNPERLICGGEEVALAIEDLTGVPASKISEDEGQKLLNLESTIHERLIGQHEAVKAVAAALRRSRVNLKDSKRPIASFLFLGPTGVGKTELAKTVAEIYFSSEDYMIRLDMSEYQEPDSVGKMIGDHDGTLGYLTEAVRKKPFSLILFDEIEKAHPDILNLFLQLLDDGRLTDGQGRTISFSQSIVIATSNIGSLVIQEGIRANTELSLIKQDLIDNQLTKYLRPELINRFDGIIVFSPLTPEEVIQIAVLMLKGIKKNLAAQGLNFQADKDGVAVLAKAGYDPRFGARPLRRLLQERVENEIANLMLANKLKRRDTVYIDKKGAVGVIKAPEL
jgi:ATP-dependent Clp protease ATP-binding subunit ClpC